MNNYRLAFALSSVLFLVVLAVSPLKDYFREWKGYQTEYNRLIITLPQRVKPAEIGIKQLWVQRLNRVDRCTTCHLGLEQQGLEHAPEPFRTHPHIYHDIEDFGCTTCHEGQGLATTAEEAHGAVKYWERPILPTAFMEASCAKCHKEENVPEAPVLTLGRKLIHESNCVGCHKLGRETRQWVPSLDGIGQKVNRTWLVNWLKRPKDYFAGTRMPNFMLSDEEVNNLADFLMTFKSFTSNAFLEPLPPSLTAATDAQKEQLIQLGETRFREARCISCHPINGRGGYVATDLGKVASKVNEQWLYNYLKDPKRLQPAVQMPRFRFNPKELAAVVAYIEDAFVDFDRKELPAHTPDPAFYEKGLELVKRFNCTGCHQLGTLSGAEQMGPDLTLIGSKKLYEIDFGTSAIDQSLPSYLSTKTRNPRIFSSAMKMPNFEFTDEEAQAVTVALLGNTNEPIPDDLRVPQSPASTYTPQGDFGKLADDLACLGCHTMFGRGRLVATNLTLEASQAQQQWIHGYFKVPYSLRPILTERMPNFFLPDREINAIVGYMETVFISDSLEPQIKVTPESVVRGKALYFERYGCQSCHQLNLKGGFVGPALDHIGSRLKAGWIYHWLKDPQAYKPEAIEPNNHLTDAEAEQLTSFLKSLK